MDGVPASKAAVVVRVTDAPIDVAAETTALSSGRSDIGGIVAFTGLCRDEGGTLSALRIEHYPGMAEAAIASVADEALRRWPLIALTIVHRFGTIRPGDTIVAVIAASAHRRAAFEAADFMMDYLKSRAPFWKREIGADGVARDWVAAKEADEDALARWT